MKEKTGWLIYDKVGAEYNRGYIQMHMEEAEYLGIRLELKYAENFCFGISRGETFLLYEQKKIMFPKFVICRTIYPFLSRHLEQMGICVFNNAKVAEICNDKWKTYAYLANKQIPMIETVFGRNKDVKENFENIPNGTVIKAVSGHGGTQVFLKEKEKKEEICCGIENENIILQKLTGKAHQDVRVYVIGKEIIAAVKRTAVEGFKSNFSLGGQVELHDLSQKEEELVKKIIGEFEFGLVGIDFLIGENGEFIFNEIEDVVGARMLYQCSKINLVRRYLEFILAKVKEKGDNEMDRGFGKV